MLATFALAGFVLLISTIISTTKLQSTWNRYELHVLSNCNVYNCNRKDFHQFMTNKFLADYPPKHISQFSTFIPNLKSKILMQSFSLYSFEKIELHKLIGTLKDQFNCTLISNQMHTRHFNIGEHENNLIHKKKCEIHVFYERKL